MSRDDSTQYYYTPKLSAVGASHCKGGAIVARGASMQLAARSAMSAQAICMHRVCLCLPGKLSELGETVMSRCSDAVSQRIKFTQCDVDDPGIHGIFRSIKADGFIL